MPRTARVKSKSGIYHVIIRGTNRQEIFHDDEDCLRFLETLAKYKVKSEIKIYGWCLMNNHIHLLVKEGKEELATTMKRIGVSFVGYYHCKYDTTGHLFQDRYKSENVESEEYLMTVIRYIHQNPIKAGLVSKPQDWKWSSYSEYYGKKLYPQELLDSELILKLFSEDNEIAEKRFKEFNEQENEDNCLDDVITTRLRDEDVRLEIKKIISGINVGQIKSLPKDQRNKIIKKAKCIEGVTQRQLARVLGVSQALISIT
ncbi:REP element-mobilizing transposase RayT [Anaerovirgula multivorans]|uniref:REP element-mobilizing transposase RayT n=1 Tax=Anaerovirgula multivorans TaxID=312168 RepID=A0A239C7G6_9FIRM|nr:transposase [Anaerovirgula multivorans]SNS15561.1 REP element-mobilizing transposase RayT [Anaerovirgula multivorans]